MSTAVIMGEGGNARRSSSRYGEDMEAAEMPSPLSLPSSPQQDHAVSSRVDSKIEPTLPATDSVASEVLEPPTAAGSIPEVTLPSLETKPPAKPSTPPESSYRSPTISITPPHLPLKQKHSADLRIRTSHLSYARNIYPTSKPIQIGSVGDMASRLRSPTNEWSRNSILPSHSPTEASLAAMARKLHARSRVFHRPTTVVVACEEEEGDTLSPLLRPSTSTPDHAFSRPPLRMSATEPLPDKSGSPRTPSTYWRDGGVSNLRESLMSTTNTNGSSNFNTSQSSVFTARSSRSTGDSAAMEWQKVSDDELSVDDCIEMYANGFKDEPLEEVAETEQAEDVATASQAAEVPETSNPATEEPATPAEGEGVKPASSRGSGTARSVASWQPSIATGNSRSSDTLVGRNRGSETSATGSRRPASTARDRYGFKQESQHVSAIRYANWHKTYKKHVERRRQKWIYLMNTSGLHSSDHPEVFPERSEEVKRYVRKGIPPEWRGAAWFFYGNGAAWLEEHRGLYSGLLHKASQGALSQNDRDHIEKDLHRTFPDNIYFKPENAAMVSPRDNPSEHSELEDTEMIKALRRMLQCYAIQYPATGYCQSLNFLAGHLLLFMRLSFPAKNYEERAFAMMCIVTEKFLPGTHGMVLEGANVDIGVLMTMLQETMPSLWAKLDDNNFQAEDPTQRKATRASVTLKTNTDRLPTVSLATTAWFMSCFVSTLPIESTCRVWDCLWYEGSKTIFRVALAIFKIGEKQIKKATEQMEVFQIVQNLPRELLDANELMEVATMKSARSIGTRIGAGTPGFGALSQKTVESRRDERRAHSKQYRESGQSGAGLRDADGKPVIALPPVPQSPPSLVRRVTLRRLKSMKKVAQSAQEA